MQNVLKRKNMYLEEFVILIFVPNDMHIKKWFKKILFCRNPQKKVFPLEQGGGFRKLRICPQLLVFFEPSLIILCSTALQPINMYELLEALMVALLKYRPFRAFNKVRELWNNQYFIRKHNNYALYSHDIPFFKPVIFTLHNSTCYTGRKLDIWDNSLYLHIFSDMTPIISVKNMNLEHFEA